jgi:hypothetical protein
VDAGWQANVKERCLLQKDADRYIEATKVSDVLR